MDDKILIPHKKTVVVKVTYDGTDLVKAREQAGFKDQSIFAARLGITQQRLSTLERPHPVTVSEPVFNRLLIALQKIQ